MKTPLIQLYLAGDRRLIHLTPATAGTAYDLFANVNPGYLRRIRTSFESNDSCLYKLWHSSYFGAVDWHDVRTIESELNRQVIDNNLDLVENEGRLFDGATNAIDICKGRTPSSYIFRYGMKFTVEPLIKTKLFGMKNIDLFWQDRDLNFHYVCYCGLISSPHQEQIKLLFRYPLDLSKTWTFMLSEFQPRQILKIRSISPCKGFYLKC
jgi:hypothetical protein